MKLSEQVAALETKAWKLENLAGCIMATLKVNIGTWQKLPAKEQNTLLGLIEKWDAELKEICK